MARITLRDFGLGKALRKAPDQIRSETKDLLRRESLLAQRRIEQNLSGRALKVRTGRLRRSIGSKVTDSPRGAIAEVGPTKNVPPRGRANASPLVYAGILEFGGEITPNPPRRFLTIPTEESETASGVARWTAAELRDSPESFGFDETFIHEGTIFGFKFNRDEPIPLFNLVKRVTIDPHPFLTPEYRQMIRVVEIGASAILQQATEPR